MMTSMDHAKSKDLRNTGGRALVVIPCLNEAEHLEDLIATLLGDAGRTEMRIVVADGGSTDGSQAIVRRLMEHDRRLVLLDNRQEIQSAGVNKAVDAYGNADFLIRIDAHAWYPPRYCEKLLDAQFETGADSIVVSMHAEGRSCFQRAAAAAQNSILGNGGSPHRNKTAGRWVDHGHHALMTIACFKAVGGYDESFSHNEDAELDLRLRTRGFRIFLTEKVSVTYYPRRALAGLFRQYFNFGGGRARNFLKHRQWPKLRQMLPLAVAPALGLALLAPLSLAFTFPMLVWATCCIGYGVWLGVTAREACAAVAGVAAMTMHLGWSIGFFAHLLRRGLRTSGGPRGLGAQAAP